MLTGLEGLVVELVVGAILTNMKLTQAKLTELVENHPDYHGTTKGKALERRIKNILKDERVLQQIQEETKSENNITLGFKIGRLEIKGKLKLD